MLLYREDWNTEVVEVSCKDQSEEGMVERLR